MIYKIDRTARHFEDKGREDRGKGRIGREEDRERGKEEGGERGQAGLVRDKSFAPGLSGP